MTDKITVAGAAYSEPPPKLYQGEIHPIESRLHVGETLLHECWIQWPTGRNRYSLKNGFLGITNFRAIEYRIGKANSVSVEWELAIHPQFLAEFQRSYDQGSGSARRRLVTGIQVLYHYESNELRPTPTGENSKRDSEQVVTLYQRTFTPELASRRTKSDFSSLPEAAKSLYALSSKFTASQIRWNESIHSTGKWTRGAQKNMQNQVIQRKLSGPTATLLRIDELLEQAAEDLDDEGED